MLNMPMGRCHNLVGYNSFSGNEPCLCNDNDDNYDNDNCNAGMFYDP